MSGNLDGIVDSLSDLSVGDLAKVAKMLQEKWGVSGAAPVAAAGSVAGAAPVASEKSSFDIMLTSAGASKIAVIKVVREITGLSLTEAKAIVDGAPKALQSGVEKAKAEEIKAKLEQAGASVELK